MRSRSVERTRYGVFLDRATEFLDAAQDCRSRGHHQAAVSNAVHAAIAAVDAVTVFHVGKRGVPQRHEDAVHLLGMLGLPESEVEPRARQLRRLLGLKTKAEYTDDLVTADEAKGSVQDAERLVTWAKKQVGRP